jgi:hypothetical protein
MSLDSQERQFSPRKVCLRREVCSLMAAWLLVRLVVPILPEKFEPTFRSFSPEESLFIKQIMSREPNQNDQYLLEKFSLAQLTCALVSINGKPLPEHRDKDGSPDEKLFRDKLKTITKKSAYIVADLMINYAWFDLRVRRLLNPDDLKNG